MRTARKEAHAYLHSIQAMTCMVGIGHPEFGDYVEHDETCDRLTAAIEARDAEHANERLAVKLKAAKLTGALDVARTALGTFRCARCRVGLDTSAGHDNSTCATVSEALTAIAKALSETP